MKRNIDLLSAKFVEAGLVAEGVTYKTPAEPVPLSALFVQESEPSGPMLNNVKSEPFSVEGITVNFISRSVEGSINLSEQQLQKIQTSLRSILKLHDELRSGATVKIVIGFVLE